MIRHIDAVYDLNKTKRVFGFFIIEADNKEGIIPNEWIEYSESTINEEALRKSLPHRSKKQIKDISNCFLGVTTWNAVCNEFGISLGTLPNEVL